MPLYMGVLTLIELLSALSVFPNLEFCYQLHLFCDGYVKNNFHNVIAFMFA